MVVLTRRHRMIVPDEEDVLADSKIHNIVIEANDLLRVRERIGTLYFNQKVIVAPCLSKLYLSRKPTQIHDDDWKTSPDWIHFGTGMIAIIYDAERSDVKMTLFDKNDVRLLWCLKWAEFVNFQMPTSNFHIINTEADNTHHVGILYENKDVAELIAHTVTLLYDNAQIASVYNKNHENSKFKLGPRRSLPIRRKNYEINDGIERRNSLRDFLTKRASKNSSKDLPQTRETRSATMHEFSGIVARRAIQNSLEGGRPKSDCSDQAKLVKLSRADSFRKMRSKSFDVAPTEKPEKLSRKASGGETSTTTSFKDNIVKVLFKKRRISRTQSLKVEADDDGITKTNSHGDCKQYERAVKLVKPRAQTDPILLHGDSMRFLIETGLSARNERERKHWFKTLSTEHMPSTDLCVTEL